MTKPEEFMLHTINVARKHSHVNAITTFSKIAAHSLHSMPVQEYIDWEIVEYEEIIKTLKKLKDYYTDLGGTL